MERVSFLSYPGRCMSGIRGSVHAAVDRRATLGVWVCHTVIVGNSWSHNPRDKRQQTWETWDMEYRKSTTMRNQYVSPCAGARLASRDSQWEGCDCDEDEGQLAAGVCVVMRAVNDSSLNCIWRRVRISRTPGLVTVHVRHKQV